MPEIAAGSSGNVPHIGEYPIDGTLVLNWEIRNSSNSVVGSSSSANGWSVSSIDTSDVTVGVPGGASVGDYTIRTYVPAIPNYFNAAFSVTAGTAPTISSFTPSSARYGANVVISGSNFTGATAVKFGATDAVSFSIDSDSQITAVAPNISNTPVALHVTNGAGTGDSATNYTALAPATPSVPTGMEHRRVTDSDHRLRARSPSVLISGAATYSLKIYRLSLAGSASSSAVTGNQLAEVAMPLDYFFVFAGRAAWVATNAAGSTESASVPFDFLDGGVAGVYSVIQATGPLPNLPDAMPAPTESTADALTFIAPAEAVYYQISRGPHTANGPGDWYFGAGPLLTPGQEGTASVSVVGNPAELCWRALTPWGSAYGPSTIFEFGAGPVEPPAPVVTIDSGTQITVDGIGFDDSWDGTPIRASFRWWPVSASTARDYNATGLHVTPITEDTPLVVSSNITPNIPYLCNFIALGADGSVTYGPTTAFTPTSTGGPSPSAPDAPGELEIQLLSDTRAAMKMPTKPANADSLRLQQKIGGTWTSLAGEYDGADVATVNGLSVSTSYLFRALSVNAYGQTAGPELDLRTRATPSESAAPDQPAAPELVSKSPTRIILSQPEWPTDTTELKLLRREGSGEWQVVETFDDPSDTYTDTDVLNGHSYDYAAIAHNSNGDSAQSETLTVSLIGTAVPSWLSPDAGSIAGLVPLLASVDGPSGISATAPLQVLYNGAALPGTTRTNSTNPYAFKTLWDTGAVELQDSATLSLVATDANGFQSAPVPRTFTLNNSLRSASVLETFIIKPAVSDAMQANDQRVASIRCVGLPQIVDAATDPWIRTYFVSPDPGEPENDWTAEEVAEYLQKFQLIRPADWSRRVTVLGQRQDSGAWTRSDHTGRWAMVWTPPFKLTKYTVDSSAVVKLRRITDDTAEWFSINPARYGTMGPDGLAVLYSLGDAELAEATDAAHVGDKIFAIVPPDSDQTAGVWLVDLDDDDLTVRIHIKGEAGVATFVEAANGVAFLFYVGEGVTSIYQRSADNTRAGFDSIEIEAEVTLTAARETYLAYATDEPRVYQSSGGAEPVQVFPASGNHTAAIAALHLNSSGVYEVVDADGKIYRKVGSSWSIIATIAGADAAGQFQGNAETLKGVAGRSDSALLYIQSGAGVYTSRYTVSGAAGVLALERQLLTLAAGSGDPLQGGVAPDTQERLLIGVEADGEGDAFIAVLEEAGVGSSEGFNCHHFVLLSFRVTGRTAA